MRPNPKKLSKRKIKLLREAKAAEKTQNSKGKIKNALANLPSSDTAAAHRREMELGERAALRTEICQRIGKFRSRAHELGLAIVDLANDGREIGLLVLKDWESLPGKQLTTDFWQKQQEQWVDAMGQPILLEQLKYFVKIAMQNPQPFLPDDIMRALSYRQELLSLGGFELSGEAPGDHAQPPANVFLKLTQLVGRLPRDFTTAITALEQDEHFGAIEKWDADRRAVFRARLEPLHKSVNELFQRLGGV